MFSYTMSSSTSRKGFSLDLCPLFSSCRSKICVRLSGVRRCIGSVSKLCLLSPRPNPPSLHPVPPIFYLPLSYKASSPASRIIYCWLPQQKIFLVLRPNDKWCSGLYTSAVVLVPAIVFKHFYKSQQGK